MGERSFGDKLAGLFDAALIGLFPPRCGICERPLATRPAHHLCPLCYEVLEDNNQPRCGRCDLPGSDPCARCIDTPPPYDGLRAPYLYGEGLAEMLARAKFSRREDLAVGLGHLLADDSVAADLAREATALAPIPLGKVRRRERGFNQSAVIAGVLAKRWSLPMRYALTRARETLRQSDLALAARRENIQGAFMCAEAPAKNVVLVDDIVTSGETVAEATRALKAAGVENVWVVAIARRALEK